MKLKKLLLTCSSVLVTAALLNGCASVDRINNTMDQADLDYDRAQRHMSNLQAQSRL